MIEDHFKYFLSAAKIIAVHTDDVKQFEDISRRHKALVIHNWKSGISNAVNFQKLIEVAIATERSRILIAGCNLDNSCLIISLLALGRGFDVFLCIDLINGPESEKMLLSQRLRQCGAVIVNLQQIEAEFAASTSILQ